MAMATERAGRAKPLVAADEPGGDLWGYPPRPPVTCPGCGVRAEPHVGKFCFLCVCSGQADFVLNGSTVYPAERRRMLAG